MRDMRVLLLAEMCHPRMPSLPVVGYKLCRAIAARVKAVVATHVRFRDACESAGIGQAEMVFIDNEYLAAPMTRLATFLRRGRQTNWMMRTAFKWPSYLVFEWEVRKRFRNALRRGDFDLVHRVTPMSPTTPSPMSGWSPVPFVIGPLNGGLPWPAEYVRERKREREYLAPLRSIHKWLPYYGSTYSNAAAILAAFDHTAHDLPRSSRDRVFNIPEVGVAPDIFKCRPIERETDRITFLFVGRFAPLKCADALIAAFADSRLLRQHRLRLIGGGQEEESLKRMVNSAGLESCVEFSGWMSQEEVGAAMRDSDVFVFPSIRELGGGVVAEAMASGLACVVLDYGGPGALIGSGRGIKVPLGSKNELRARLRREMEQLVAAPDRIRKLGRAAHEFAMQRLSWDAKADQIVQIYEWALGTRTERPQPYQTEQAFASTRQLELATT